MIFSCPFNLNGTANRVLWEVTSLCNMKCAHCLYYPSLEHKLERDISTEEVASIVEQMRVDGTIDQVWLSGGEPLLRPDILQIVGFISDAGMKPSVSTNGYLVSEKMATSLKSNGVDYVHLSVDGVNAQQHDNFRNKKGAFDHVLSAADNLLDVGIVVGATCIVTWNNIDDMERLVCLSLAHKIKVLSFYMVEPLGRGKAFNSRLDIKLMMTLREQFFKLRKKYESQLRLELFRTAGVAQDALDQCRCFKFYTITNDGRLGGCPWLMKTEHFNYSVSLRDTTFSDARHKVRHNLESLLRKRVVDLSCCTNCQLNSSCGKGCIAVSGNDGTDPLCSYAIKRAAYAVG